MDGLAFAQVCQQLGALGVQVFFEQRAAADDDIAAAAVQLRDANLNLLAGQRVQILRWAQIVLRAGQESANADVNYDATLDAIDDFARERLLRLEGGFQLFPRAAAQHLLITDNRVAVFFLAGALHFDRGVRIRARDLRVGKFRGWDQALGLHAEVHDHAVFRVSDNLDRQNFVLCVSFLLLIVLRHELAHLFRAGGLFGSGDGFRIRRGRGCGGLGWSRSGCRFGFGMSGGNFGLHFFGV